MKEESTTQGVNPEQLRRLFDIGRDTKKSDEAKGGNQQRTEMLCRSLSQPLPLDQSPIDLLPSSLGPLCHSISLFAGETISELLSNPSTDIPFIQSIKRWSKEWSTQTKSIEEKDVAVAIYYASIAHALVFHNRRITRFSYKELESAFSRLVNKEWITKDLSALLLMAGKVCKEKAGS